MLRIARHELHWVTVRQTKTTSLLASRYRSPRQVGVAGPSMLFRQRQPRFQRRREPSEADFLCEVMVLAGHALIPRHAYIRRAVARWFSSMSSFHSPFVRTPHPRGKRHHSRADGGLDCIPAHATISIQMKTIVIALAGSFA